MPETKGTVEAIEKWEAIPKRLAKLGLAKLVEDSTFDESVEDSLVYSRVYQIFVGSGYDLEEVNWRFHYNEHVSKKSSLTLSEQELSKMLNSRTVHNVLDNLNIEMDDLKFEQVLGIMERVVMFLETGKKWDDGDYVKVEKVKKYGKYPLTPRKICHYMWSRVYNGGVLCGCHLKPPSKPSYHQFGMRLETWLEDLPQHPRDGNLFVTQDYNCFGFAIIGSLLLTLLSLPIPQPLSLSSSYMQSFI